MELVDRLHKEGITIIMITHRFNLNTYVDQVIYMGKHGKIEEQGCHQELVSRPTGLYRKMWENFISVEKSK